uniref:ARAD1D18524p n=1 Tax=Blastobotrys adeninivorans TaxID=409370 RepID=A0A060T9Y3_BLAAD
MSGHDMEKATGSVEEHLSDASPPVPIAHDYILKRHGTLELEPMPTNDPQDPLNWPELKKFGHLFLVAFNAMSGSFFAAGIVPSYETLAEEYGVPLASVSYYTSVQILIFGIFTFLWFPLMSKYGRRPMLTLCALLATATNIGCGFCKDYGSQMACRILNAIFMSPAFAVGNVVVTEMYFSHQRGSRNGVWAMMLTLGPSFGPFLMSFVEQHAGTKWVFFVFAFMSFGIFVGWVLADETMYLRNENEGKGVKAFFGFITKTPHKITLADYLDPLKRALNYRVMVATCAYAICFGYTSVALSVEMPEVMGQKFNLDAQGVGLQFISIMIGCGLGEIASGPLSDYWMNWRVKKRGGVRIIEDRLWISYNGFIFIMFGIIIWGVRTQQAEQGKWNVTPLVGAAFASAGLQMVTTVLITYTIDADPTKSAESGLFTNLVRQVWSFIGPFYFPDMFKTLGFGGAAGLMAGIVGFSGLWIITIHFIGLRKNHASLL